MKLRTEIKAGKFPFNINHNHKLLCLGSCFAENIGRRLGESKFDCTVNPMGIAYNPLSLSNLLITSEEELTNFSEKDNFHYDLHSSFFLENFKENNHKIFNAKKRTNEALEQAEFVFITFGTAWVYENIETTKVVNNCHKQGANLFTKRLLKVNEIVESFTNLYHHFWERENQNIILTVSPIRHLKDGIRENQLSKSVLHLAVNSLVEKFKSVHYFPSYEYMMDDLRDYRFYEEDMLHPNKIALEYIWGKFADSYFSSQTFSITKEWEKLQVAMQHRAFKPSSEEHQKFLNNLRNKLKHFQEKNKIDCSEELKSIV